ncbi:MAG TPA: winged helix-turn-helix domain-containing protein [Terriglobia bacterium]|nr:winged helix-turn-helix domain-containing protein [Terriglobia bacterium]
MNTTYPIAAVGELIGEPARAAILIALLDGNARTAGELALIANISAQSASAHLSKLVDGGLLSVRRTGRHRYYALAGPEVVHVLEALGSISTLPRARPAAPGMRAPDDMYAARRCYDHLAGRIAVDLSRALEQSKVIRPCGERDYELGHGGLAWLANLGIDVDALRRSRRAFARQCLDWTEHRPHIAGALGAALYSRLIALGWIACRRDTRALRITRFGVHEFHSRLGLTALTQSRYLLR